MRDIFTQAYIAEKALPFLVNLTVNKISSYLLIRLEPFLIAPTKRERDHKSWSFEIGGRYVNVPIGKTF